MKQIYKTPRLYIDAALGPNANIELGPDHAHYLKSVLRLPEGEPVRVFNGRDGEWLCTIARLGKKAGTLRAEQNRKPQPTAKPEIHLLFAPIKKHRMDFLIEKAVELGASDLHPVITAHTQNHKINQDRLQAQIIEAAEQCERMDIPTLHPIEKLGNKLQNIQTPVPIYWAAERLDAAPIHTIASPQSFLIGPEGGFSEDEITTLSAHKDITPVSLGENILRAETAALFCLSHPRR